MTRRRRKKLQRKLVQAAAWAGLADVRRLIRAGADPDLPDQAGTTPLYRASVQNRADVAAVLLAAGADPNRESGAGEEGLPLCGAACWGHDATVRVLLAAGADPARREDGGHGHSALDWAAFGPHPATVAILTGTAGD